MAKIRRKKTRNIETGMPAVAVVWYPDEEQWAAMRSIAVDSDIFEESHEAWIVMFEKSIEKLAAAGVMPVRTPINIDEYKQWCQVESKSFDRSSRAEYAAVLLRQAHKPSD